MPKLDDYLAQCNTDTCRWCGTTLSGISAYPHPDGWPVDGMDGLQWLYRPCPKCEYEWSLWKLGVPRYEA